MGPKVSHNFGSVPTRRNPARVAKIDGGMGEAEVAGGSPRKKPHGQPRGEETFLLRLDRGKAATEQGRKESIGLVEDRAEGGRPKEALPKTMKPPPSHRRATRRSLTRMRSSPTTRTARTVSRTAVPRATKRSSRLAVTSIPRPSSVAARTIGPKAAAPINPSASLTRTMRSSTMMRRPTSRPTPPKCRRRCVGRRRCSRRPISRPTPPPKCRRRCLIQRRCLDQPPAAKPRGEPDRA